MIDTFSLFASAPTCSVGASRWLLAGDGSGGTPGRSTDSTGCISIPDSMQAALTTACPSPTKPRSASYEKALGGCLMPRASCDVCTLLRSTCLSLPCLRDTKRAPFLPRLRGEAACYTVHLVLLRLGQAQQPQVLQLVTRRVLADAKLRRHGV